MKKIKISSQFFRIIFLCVILNLGTGIFAYTRSDLSVKEKKKSEYINPFIGTAGDHGQTDPSANIPFSMIKPGPDTDPGNHSGYNYDAERLIGFSQTRFSGVGCDGVGGNLRILPFININQEFTEINKRSEVASAGYYGVELGNGIRAEITSGRTTAFYRFVYPERKEDGGISIDFKSAFSEFVNESHTITNNKIKGWIKSKCSCKMGLYKIFYYMELSEEPVNSILKNGKLKLIFDIKKSNTLTVKIALSSVSENEAQNNLEKETSLKSFDQVKYEAQQNWDKLCETIDVETDNDTLKTLFYTHLYHATQSPFNIIDYSGSYLGSDNKTYNSDLNSYYYGWSVWDTFRTKLPMLSLLFPDIYSEMMSSMLKMYDQGKSDGPKMTEPFLTTRNEHVIPSNP